ncbi:MAG: hypothetical protein FWG62_00485 [Proteobacteria bacterium]|nr:hypothetical protein [Pseudomonadota bacterium]
MTKKGWWTEKIKIASALPKAIRMAMENGNDGDQPNCAMLVGGANSPWSFVLWCANMGRLIPICFFPLQ